MIWVHRRLQILWIHKKSNYFSHPAKESQLRFQEIQPKQSNISWTIFLDSHCSSIIARLNLLLSSSALDDAFIRCTLTRVQTVHHQIICGTVNKFVRTSRRVSMSEASCHRGVTVWRREVWRREVWRHVENSQRCEHQVE